jgi:broad specificity phosphatase PhoE
MLSAISAGHASAATTVVVVRHAEKVVEPENRDPALTEEGAMRAWALVRMLESAYVSSVFSSPFIRTRETLKPLAEAHGLDVQERAPMAIEELVAEIHAIETDGVVVVAGHSNTVPDIVRALGIETDLSLTEDDYDDLFAVTLHDDGSATMLHLHYGAVSE